ncbi:hypothetical protein RJ640_009166 [Escallonia rubra]|uniref:ATP-dependent RNA helicase n=1 Tax=Escallonia rubra TaxID=112253 RepID=A0AA88UKU2_9ASTE|nr:hypothetical protein RJ640_009166 [Escallonia rubra]
MAANREPKKKNDRAESQVFASCSFSSLGLHPTLCNQLRERMGFEVPTLVQAQAIPVILSGRHATFACSVCGNCRLVKAATGTGKTVAYLAPVIHHLQSKDPRVQRSDGISILVATPGRLLDHLKNTSSFIHTNMRWIIFDEADRILELGFGKEIEEILDILGSRQDKSLSNEKAISSASELPRQNLLLSATLNDKVNHLAQISLENPVMIGLDDKKIQPKPSQEIISSLAAEMDNTLGHSEKILSPSNAEYNLPAQLVQRYVKVSCGSRLVALLSILNNLFKGDATQKVVVFFSTCDAVDYHYSLLSEFRWPPNSQSNVDLKQAFVGCKTFRLHGNMQHEDRRTTFHTFKTEKSAVLLSTDVAARGLDFPKVRCIIQYDSPGEASEYVHRVGRTARLGEKGDSLLFLQPVEIDYLRNLEKHGVLLTEYPLVKLLDSFPLYGQKHNAKKLFSLEMHPWVLHLQKALESYILRESTMKKLAQNAFCSWVRAYSAHRGDLKSIFMVKKLHLGHVARSFALKEQPSLVGRSFQNQAKKRKRDLKQKGVSKKRRIGSKS